MFNIKNGQPPLCGGSTTNYDSSMPKEIKSDEITLFEISHSFRNLAIDNPRLFYFSTFVVPVQEGTFIYLETLENFSDSPKTSNWVYIKKNIMPELNNIVRKYDIAKENGKHHHTSGLPENFGGSINIKYVSEEEIDITDNQFAILNYYAAIEIVDLLKKVMEEESASLPSVEALKELTLQETFKDGEYTKKVLVLNKEGTGLVNVETKFGDIVNEYSYEVSKENIDEIKAIINNSALALWQYFPVSDNEPITNKEVIATMENGDVFIANNSVQVPIQFSSALFNIDMKLKKE